MQGAVLPNNERLCYTVTLGLSRNRAGRQAGVEVGRGGRGGSRLGGRSALVQWDTPHHTIIVELLDL